VMPTLSRWGGEPISSAMHLIVLGRVINQPLPVLVPLAEKGSPCMASQC
jgi:hypothetical protein